MLESDWLTNVLGGRAFVDGTDIFPPIWILFSDCLYSYVLTFMPTQNINTFKAGIFLNLIWYCLSSHLMLEG